MGDYTKFVDAARNKITGYVPLYDHIVAANVIEEIINKKFAALIDGDAADRAEYFKTYNGFFETMGYDAIPFECVQDIVGFENLCLVKYDDEDLYKKLFTKMGDLIAEIWKDFLQNFGGAYCVLRMGDDLGFKNNTMLPPDDIRENIFPAHKKVIDMVHGAGKPFLLHCCGQIFDVMDGLIALGIDAKHSNEDQIAPFAQWVDAYGKRIALFGGIDTNYLIRMDEKELAAKVKEVCSLAAPRCGFALGCGNSIAEYVPAAKYLAMNRAAREWRGEKV